MSEDEEASEAASTTSLEEKMKSWEASEEEIKAATLGGVVPPGGGSGDGVGRTDAFDVGLYIAFPIMVLACLAVSDLMSFKPLMCHFCNMGF